MDKKCTIALVAIFAGCSVKSGQAPVLPRTQPLAAAPDVSAYNLRDDSGRPIPHTHVMLPPQMAAFVQPRSGFPVFYHGGAVQVKPSIYLVFWGWTQDPSHELTTLPAFYRTVGGTRWLNVVTQYYQVPGYHHIENVPGQLAGVWNDPSNAPRGPSINEVAREALRLAKHFHYYSINASYVVATPYGHYARGFGKKWCAYHGAARTSNGTIIPFTNLPYFAPGGPCTGSVSPPDYLAIAGHELAETQTDPDAGYGWFDQTGQEIGDKCQADLRDKRFGRLLFVMQALWSNKAGECVF